MFRLSRSACLSAIFVLPGVGTGFAQQPTATVDAPSPWVFSNGDKHEEFADLASTDGKAHLVMLFEKHKLNWIGVMVPTQFAIKKPTHRWTSQLGEDKLDVSLAYNAGTAKNETWGYAKHPHYTDLLLAPRNLSNSPYKAAMKSKTFSITYKDLDGNDVTETFELADMAAQMKAHKEGLDHIGVLDILSDVAPIL